MRERRDRLSELPQSLIHHILSFLPMRDVVSTTVLSKRWNNLWTTVPCLNFCHNLENSILVDGADSVRNFVNRALMFWRGTKILKFKIAISNVFNLSLAGDFDLWIRFAVEYKVEDLSIDLSMDDYTFKWGGDEPVMEDVYSTPQCLNSCSSIKKLSLVGCNLRIDGSPTWYQLTSFKFDGFWFSESLTNQILLGSPCLEVFDLTFMECFENLNIWSTRLKKLKIKKYIYYVKEYPTDISHTLLSICCPNLETLEMSGALYGKHYLSNFSCLTDAILGYHCARRYGAPGLLGENLCQILPAIQHVENLAFSSAACVQELVVSLRTNLPSPFPNVKFLKLQFDLIELDDMINLLGIFPSLKMLVIEDETLYGSSPEFNIKKFLEFEISVSNSFLRQLKTIHVTSRFFDSSIFQFIALLLKHASMLEKLVVWAEWGERAPHAFAFKVANVLLNIPRSSSTAMVIINPK